MCGYSNEIALIEAGRGPGGRMATRRRRDDPVWRLDHGAPGFMMSTEPSKGVEELLAPLKASGTLKREQRSVLLMDEEGRIQTEAHDGSTRTDWWRGTPCMASICEQMLEANSHQLHLNYGTRIRTIERDGEMWKLKDEPNERQIVSRKLVLSGTLLAHPRSLAMLGWSQVPLRQAVAKGQDADLDEALEHLAESKSDIRWNWMVDLGTCPEMERPLPRQILLTKDAQVRWQVERLVLHEQDDGRIGLVVHGMDPGHTITPDTQPRLMAEQERRLSAVLPKLLRAYPALLQELNNAKSLGMMRWGAAQPLDHPLPSRLQWCNQSQIGFCGDWIEGDRFGTAEASLSSAVNLAKLIADQNDNK